MFNDDSPNLEQYTHVDIQCDDIDDDDHVDDEYDSTHFSMDEHTHVDESDCQCDDIDDGYHMDECDSTPSDEHVNITIMDTPIAEVQAGASPMMDIHIIESTHDDTHVTLEQQIMNYDDQLAMDEEIIDPFLMSTPTSSHHVTCDLDDIDDDDDFDDDIHFFSEHFTHHTPCDSDEIDDEDDGNCDIYEQYNHNQDHLLDSKRGHNQNIAIDTIISSVPRFKDPGIGASPDLQLQVPELETLNIEQNDDFLQGNIKIPVDVMIKCDIDIDPHVINVIDDVMNDLLNDMVGQENIIHHDMGIQYKMFDPGIDLHRYRIRIDD